MPIRVKQFACGHKGRGQYCHACAQQEAVRRAKQEHREARHSAKVARAVAFNHDPIDLRILPSESLIDKARGILRHITQTRDYRPFFGKRMETDRTLLSVPLNYRYRLMFRVHSDRIVPLAVMSHERYNHAKERLCITR